MNESISCWSPARLLRPRIQRSGITATAWAEAKTAPSRQLVDLPELACEALRSHHKVTIAEDIGEVPWVFSTPHSKPMRRSHFHAYVFQPLLKRAKLPKIRFHDLRHTSATLLFPARVHPKVVQERLGHAQISVTMDAYSRVLPGAQREAAAKFDKMLAERSGIDCTSP